MNIYIHAGGPKTGTSAIQYFLLRNRTLLKGKGYLYPNHFIDDNNISSGHSFLVQNNESSFQKGWADRIEAEIENNEKYNLILSSETFIFFIDKIAKKYPNAKIIYYVRRPDHLAISAYMQLVKRHGLKRHFSFRDLHIYLPFYNMLNKLKTVYPKDQLIFRIYEKQQLIDGSIYADFLDAIGIKLTDDFRLPDKKINSGYTIHSLEYKRMINALVPDSNVFDQYLQKYSDQFDEIKSIENLVPPQVRLDIIANFDSDNRDLAENYLGRGDGRLFYDDVPDISSPWKPFVSISFEKSYEISNFILKHNKLLIEELLSSLYRSEEGQDKHFKFAKKNLLKTIEKCLGEKKFKEIKTKIQNELEFESDSKELFQKSKRVNISISNNGLLNNTYDFSSDVKSIELVNGNLHLASSGDDPYFSISRIKLLPGSKKSFIKIAIVAPEDTFMQLHYQTKDEPAYGNGKYINAKLKKGFNDKFFTINNKDFNGQIRIDPGNRQGMYKINEIGIKQDGLTYLELLDRNSLIENELNTIYNSSLWKFRKFIFGSMSKTEKKRKRDND